MGMKHSMNLDTPVRHVRMPRAPGSDPVQSRPTILAAGQPCKQPASSRPCYGHATSSAKASPLGVPRGMPRGCADPSAPLHCIPVCIMDNTYETRLWDMV